METNELSLFSSSGRCERESLKTNEFRSLLDDKKRNQENQPQIIAEELMKEGWHQRPNEGVSW